ncbi:DUF4365 domain-containing protein [Paenilisteria rocourtiae]|uniref:Uncharacterized protein DUF4365 n=2 Tax=Listeria rocourtiae TaxID=647910 RepID=A0A4R6ZK11_9LIST|nr:DUF4365 domain-containing protein [Listeria rocourtiae]MBC1436205.1 DUF4365 domain-containing protein [Listeria rocourtiae]MBC1605647.1 DUF4365 domain-containing protein [Listeria rocourtiae]TDR52673.1 uncharacterized protein DUF4365 [Listeria rocourtiae]
MSFSNDQKEQLSVNAVTTYIVRSEYMVPSIPVGDKAPSYDGHITLYKHQNSKKKDMVGNIPVQVKGTTNKKILQKKEFPVKLIDLKNYYEGQGVIYFVVYIYANAATKIFYRDLTRLELKDILRNPKGNKQEVTIDFIEIDEDVDDFRQILVNFNYHRDFQTKYALDIDPTDIEYENLVFKWVGKRNDPVDFIQKNGVISYIKKGELYIPYKRFEANELQLKEVSQKELCVKSKNSRAYMCMSRAIDNIVTIDIGEYNQLQLVLDINSTKTSLNSKLIGSLDDYIDVLGFMKDFLDNKEIWIDRIEFKIGENHDIEKSNQINDSFDYFVELKQILEYHKIPTNFDFYKLNESEQSEINRLYNTHQTKNKVSVEKFIINSYPVYTVANEQGCVDIFDESFIGMVKVSIDIENKDTNMSVFCAIPANEWEKFASINFDLIVYSVVDLDYSNQEVYGCVSMLALRLVGAFDATGNMKFLYTAKKILEILPEQDGLNGVYRDFNILQIIKRERDFNLEEMKKILTIQESYKDNELITLGALILLGSNADARAMLENGTYGGSEQMPILNLLK